MNFVPVSPNGTLQSETLSAETKTAKLPPQNQEDMLKQHKTGKPSEAPSAKPAAKTTKISPNFEDPFYDSLRSSVDAILQVSTKFLIKESRTKGAVLVCGEDTPSAQEEGLGISILPLKIRNGPPGTFEDNSLIQALGHYAQRNSSYRPELVLGLCCNNWSMYYGRNALIEAILEVLGPENKSKLSIHSAIDALDLNPKALGCIICPSEQEEATAIDEEQATRMLHANAFAESAKTYEVGFDTIQDRCMIAGVSKKAFVEDLSKSSIQAVERTLSSRTTGQRAIDLVLEILKHRRLIQTNMNNKRFRRARSQNSISDISRHLREIFAAHLDVDDLPLAHQLPGWDDFTKANGGVASAILGLVCHSIDVLAGCVGRSSAEITPAIAERLVLTAMARENRLMEYAFGQVFELMPSDVLDDKEECVYIYRRPGDLQMFSTMTCGVVEMGGKF